MLEPDSKFRQWENIEGLVVKTASHIYTRVVAAKLTHRISVDDLIQEGAATWVKACDTFDPEKGFAFSTYLTRAMYTNLNRWVDRQGNIKGGEMYGFVSIHDQIGDDGNERQELIADECDLAPELLLDLETEVNRRADQLSPHARRTYALMVNPPDWLLEELRAQRELAEARFQAGLAPSRKVPTLLQCIETVMQVVWEFSDRQTAKIRSEICAIQ